MSDSLFIFKKLIGAWLKPLPLTALLLLAGLFLLWRGRRRLGMGLLTGATLLLLVFSNGYVARQLLTPLEQQYASYDGTQVEYILVLGSSHHSGPGIPVTSVLERDSLYRLIEGLRIGRQNPGAKIILSGYAFYDDISNARAYQDVALSLGVAADRLLLLESARDTAEELEQAARIAGSSPMALVTSAYHMPRAMALARARGIETVPAPTWHKVKPSSSPWPGILPTPSALDLSHRAIHEYLGLLWYRLSGKI